MKRIRKKKLNYVFQRQKLLIFQSDIINILTSKTQFSRNEKMNQISTLQEATKDKLLYAAQEILDYIFT